MNARILDGRTAIVTGASEGLGRAETVAFAVAGADLVINARSARLVGVAIEEFGRLDILVNNAGIIRDRMVFNMSADEWDDVLRVRRTTRRRRPGSSRS